MLTFGPVPSRRLGRSLGINNIPPKSCPYACVYCQVGATTRMSITRRRFYAPEEILSAVKRKLARAREENLPIDALTFVPDGEPTLDIHLDREIREMKSLGPKIAVISNASLIWQPAVREALAHADWVSLKFDTVDPAAWRRIDRPHGKLSLEAIMDGARAFAAGYSGELVTETMLVRGINDDEPHLQAAAAFIAELKPACAFISIPTRPPAENWVAAPAEDAQHLAYQIFRSRIDPVAYLISHEGTDFDATDDVEADLLDITAVHPMRADAMAAFLEKAGKDESVVEKLVAAGALVKVSYRGEWFFVRRFRRRGGGGPAAETGEQR